MGKRPDLWYRYVDIKTMGYPGGDVGVEVTLLKFPVAKTTPKGVQLNVYGHFKFVMTGGYKRWAYPTAEAAMVGFLKRKKKQKAILTAQLEHCNEAITLAEGGETKTQGGPLWFKSLK